MTARRTAEGPDPGVQAATPDEVPPVTTPVDPDVLATPDSGLELATGRAQAGRHHRGGPGRARRRLRAEAPGPRRRPSSRRRTASAAGSTRCARSRPGLYAEAGAMRIPRAHDLTLALLRPVRPPAAAVRDGQPEGARPRRRPADDDGGGGSRPERLPFELDGARARPDRRRAVGGGDRATCARWSSSDGDGGWDEIVREYDQYSLYEFLRFKGWSRGRDRVLRGHELRRGGHAQRGRRGPARGPRRRVRRHAGDRRRHGPAAERVLRGSCRTRSGSAPRSSRSTRIPTG